MQMENDGQTCDMKVFLCAFKTAHALLELYNIMDKLCEKMVVKWPDNAVFGLDCELPRLDTLIDLDDHFVVNRDSTHLGKNPDTYRQNRSAFEYLVVYVQKRFERPVCLREFIETYHF